MALSQASIGAVIGGGQAAASAVQASMTAAASGIMGQYSSVMQGLPAAPDLSTELTNISALLGQLSAGPGQYQGEAQNYAAQNMGFSSGASLNAELSGMLNATPENTQGLSDAERAQYERANRTTTRAMEDSAKQQLEAVLANTGSVVQYLSAADDVNQQIADQRLQGEMAILNEDYARKITELQRQDQKYALLVQQGSALASDYMKQRTEGVFNALQGWMGQASLKLNQYTTETNGILGQAKAIYDSAMMEIGWSQATYDAMESAYNSQITPILDQLNIELMQKQIGDTGETSSGSEAGTATTNQDYNNLSDSQKAQVDAYIRNNIPGGAQASGAQLDALRKAVMNGTRYRG